MFSRRRGAHESPPGMGHSPMGTFHFVLLTEINVGNDMCTTFVRIQIRKIRFYRRANNLRNCST